MEADLLIKKQQKALIRVFPRSSASQGLKQWEGRRICYESRSDTMRLKEYPDNSMVTRRAYSSDPGQIDAEVLAWLQQAYQAA
jgi:hypothetical protein